MIVLETIKPFFLSIKKDPSPINRWGIFIHFRGDKHDVG